MIVSCFGSGLQRLDPLQLLGVLKLLEDNIAVGRVGIDYAPLSLVDRLIGDDINTRNYPTNLVWPRLCHHGVGATRIGWFNGNQLLAPEKQNS